MDSRQKAVLVLAALIFAAILATVVVLRPFKNSPDIRSDGVGYHAWVHALAHQDLTFCKYGQMLRRVGAISGESDDGLRCRNKYPPGVGLLQLAFSWPFLAENPEATGYSVGENRVVFWGGAVLLFATAWLMCATLLRRETSVPVSLISVAAMVFGTGLFHYATYDASFSHVYSAFGLALILWLVDGRREISLSRLIIFAMIAGWLYAVRQTNAALGLAAAYLYFRQSADVLRWRIFIAWFAGTGLAAAILLIYGRYVSGQSSISSYGSEGFPSFGSHALDVLVSYERGLFSYYPVVAIAVLFALIRFRKPSDHAFLILIAVFALLYGSWHAWNLGAGFGHRGFVELAPFGMLVLAGSLESSSKVSRRTWMGLILLCCAATTFSMTAYWRGDLPFEGAVGSQYWRSLGPSGLFPSHKLSYSKNDVRNVRLAFDSADLREDGQWDVHLSVKNGNRKTSLLGSTGPLPPLRISWRVVASGADIGQGWDTRFDVPVLDPGQVKVVTLRVPPPSSPGADRHLQFSLVLEGQFWAHDIGVAPLDVPWSIDQLASFKELQKP
jgi:hypothetical protein